MKDTTERTTAITHLAFCNKHGFTTYTELPNVTYFPTATCGCLSYKIIRSLKEAIKITKNIRHATWVKTWGSKDFKIHFVGYRDHFLWLRQIQWQLETFWYNLTHLFQERD